MRSSKISLLISMVALVVGAAACGDAGSKEPGTPGPTDPHDPARPLTPGQPVETELPPEQAEELAKIQAELEAVKGLDAAGFGEKYAVPFGTGALGYDPMSAKGLELVQASSLALDGDEQKAFAANGFVISERDKFPSFVYGYKTIYLEDLPLYVSADSVLYAVHESYDSILKSVETAALIPGLDRLLAAMRAALVAGAGKELSAESRADADLYLSVAKSLLSGTFEPPVAGGNATQAKALFDGAVAAAGWQEVLLFDVPRNVDFSQFVPRGHYKDSEELTRYFRSMMWLGRVDFRILETQEDHSQVFHRRQLEAAYVLRALMDAPAVAEWKSIDTTIGAFVGEHDNMTLPELDSLLADLGVTDVKGLSALSDAAIAQAVVTGGYGTQRISSHIMINGVGSGTMPLSSTFLLFGQRYVLDSHVFSNVVYDRVQGGNVMRMMPNPLDASFAAFGNNQAGQLLLPELTEYKYAPDLASMRILADFHPAEYWDANLYNLWVGTLRTLSPNPTAPGLPKVATTEAWGRRLLNTQHASWSELRHDTILYVKQSYTGGSSCEYPDAYVDPYPEFYAKLAEFASRGATLVAGLDLSKYEYLAENVNAYFANLGKVALTLEAMAKNQRTGAPHTAEHLAFINQAVSIQEGCGEPVGFDGWYSQLFYDNFEGIELDPVIADVHTQPTDEFGGPVGRVLHVGTGMPRLMVVSVDSCNGPRAYVGLSSSYFEKITEQFDRLDDERWLTEILQATPADVPWMTPIVVR